MIRIWFVVWRVSIVLFENEGILVKVDKGVI